MAGFVEVGGDGFKRYEFDGRLDSAGVDTVEAALTASLRSGSSHVVFDLGQVPFVGSLGIRMLISAARVLQRQGRALVLAGVQPQVMEVFETVALSDLIPIASDAGEVAQLLAG